MKKKTFIEDENKWCEKCGCQEFPFDVVRVSFTTLWNFSYIFVSTL